MTDILLWLMLSGAVLLAAAALLRLGRIRMMHRIDPTEGAVLLLPVKGEKESLEIFLRALQKQLQGGRLLSVKPLLLDCGMEKDTAETAERLGREFGISVLPISEFYAEEHFSSHSV